MVSINDDERDFLEKIVGLENERKGYRDELKFLVETGFPSRLLSSEVNGERMIEDLKNKGLVSSRTIHGEVMDVEGDEVSSRDSERKYIRFDDVLRDLLDSNDGSKEGITGDEKDFAEALIVLADTGFSAIEKKEKELPVSLAEMLDKDLDEEERSSGLPSERFEDPMAILDSLRRKGLIKVRTEVKEKLTREPVFSAEVGDDVYSLMETDYIILTQELQENV